MKHQYRIAAGMLWIAGLAHAQLNSKIELPKDSPVGLLKADFSNSSASPRGGTNVIDVSAVLSLRNSSGKRIRGITLAVYAQDIAPGGKGSFSVSSLDVAPGEVFPVRIENRLLRPLGSVGGGIGPTVEIKLDGVLFDDLSFYGPDTLPSKNSLTVWELEARRDRKYFKGLLESAGQEGLQKEMIAGLARQGDRQRLGGQPGVQMVRGRVTNAEPEQQMQFAFIQMPDSPLEPLTGSAKVSSREARAPRFSVHNRSGRAIDHFEIAWIIKHQGQNSQPMREFFAASMPADMKLGPNQTGEIREDSVLRFQEPLAIQGITGFVSSVAFADGEYWVPSLNSLTGSKLRELLPASPEELHLQQIYSKRGLNALVQELKK
ncbi:MAG: hypothetical protein ABI824_10745 [Acidobacteriota bacterium]